MNRVLELIKKEQKRQKGTLMLIPSGNYASKDVRNAVGYVLMNKYAEGYSGKRYYQGNEFIDKIETLAIEKAKKLFGVEHVNVQPYSGSPTNSAVLFALLNSGDKIMGLKLSSGGHLTHGHPDITFSGKFFKSVQFGTKDDGVIDYDEVEKLAKKEKPKLMFIGTTAYPLILNWKRFAKIADYMTPMIIRENPEIRAVYDSIMIQMFENVNQAIEMGIPREYATLLIPNAFNIRVVEGGDLFDWIHRWKQRLCLLAQEEIFFVSLDQVKDLEKVMPEIKPMLMAPCGIRKAVGIFPRCPEGSRWCGQPVYNWQIDEYEKHRLI